MRSIRVTISAILLTIVFTSLQWGRLIMYMHCKMQYEIQNNKTGCGCEKQLMAMTEETGIDSHLSIPLVKDKVEDFVCQSIQNFPAQFLFKELIIFHNYTCAECKDQPVKFFHPPTV